MLVNKTLRSLNTPSREISLLQQDWGPVISAVLTLPILDGNLIQNLTVPSSGVVVVPHGLGRPYVGYFIVRANDYLMSCCDLVSDQNNAAASVTLRFGGYTTGTTFSLWVF